MKKEINGSETVYLISLFIMPVITFIGVALLLNVIVGISDTLTVNKYDLSNVFFREIALYMGCWVLLFVSYIFHKLGCKKGQVGVILLTVGILLYAIYLAVNTMTSIANLMNPIIVGSAAIYGLMKPLSKSTVQKRKERMKNSLNKYKVTEKKNTTSKKSNKK